MITRPEEFYRVQSISAISRKSVKGEAMTATRAEAPQKQKERNIIEALNVLYYNLSSAGQ